MAVGSRGTGETSHAFGAFMGKNRPRGDMKDFISSGIRGIPVMFEGSTKLKWYTTLILVLALFTMITHQYRLDSQVMAATRREQVMTELSADVPLGFLITLMCVSIIFFIDMLARNGYSPHKLILSSGGVACICMTAAIIHFTVQYLADQWEDFVPQFVHYCTLLFYFVLYLAIQTWSPEELHHKHLNGVREIEESTT